ncbi:dienelactone hydrolase family protein [Vibrio sp. H11]|uniref:dienelactone hydrolase family protein n=1 Tax=Vibrio sp. H11 TaxID=2565928 RepID=UPI0010A63C12|nr:dienelactone hydrolase family protein [Vibrio sp. H11]
MKQTLVHKDQHFDSFIYDFGDEAHVVFFPDWEGCHTEYAHRKAKQLAKNVNGKVLLTDIYGSGHQPKTYVGKAEAFIRKTLTEPQELRRLLAGLFPVFRDALGAEGKKISFVGVCFGGSIVFEAGRADIGVDAAVSIHGTPTSFLPLEKTVNTRFLLVQGSRDPHIPLNAVSEFMHEMDFANCCWQMLMLGGVQHSFTKEEIGYGGYGSRFNQYANDQSLHAATSFICGSHHTD